jgi:hypothetical protein
MRPSLTPLAGDCEAQAIAMGQTGVLRDQGRDAGPNRFGPSPKGIESETAAEVFS